MSNLNLNSFPYSWPSPLRPPSSIIFPSWKTKAFSAPNKGCQNLVWKFSWAQGWVWHFTTSFIEADTDSHINEPHPAAGLGSGANWTLNTLKGSIVAIVRASTSRMTFNIRRHTINSFDACWSGIHGKYQFSLFQQEWSISQICKKQKSYYISI